MREWNIDMRESSQHAGSLEVVRKWETYATNTAAFRCLSKAVSRMAN